MVQVRESVLFGIRADAHRAELEHPEAPSTQARSILREEHRTRGIQFDSERDEKKNRRKQHQTQRGTNEVDDPLNGNSGRLEHWRPKLEEWLILMPDERWANPGNFHATRRIEQLASGSETRLDNARS